MKKVVLSYGKWLSILLLISGIFVSSCSKDDGFKPNDENALNLKGYVPLENAANCDLIAGQHIYAGQVSYWNEGTDLYVQYVTTGGWYLSELHLFVGNLAELPIGKKGNPKIGDFPYFAENLAENITSYTFIIPLNQGDNCYTIAAHAVVYTEAGEEETAWSKCGPIITLKSWIKKSDGSTFWAVSDGLPRVSSTSWCSLMGTNVITENTTINLLSNSHASPGIISVTKMENKIIIDVNVTDGLQVYRTYLYVGSLDGLGDYFDPEGSFGGICPQYTTFPYKIEYEWASTHTFEIPISISESFDGNRWGWFSTYCPQ